MSEENENVPPPPSEPHPNNATSANLVNATNVKPANVANSKPANATNVKPANVAKRVTAYLPQQRGESIIFREYTVETKIIEETTSLTI